MKQGMRFYNYIEGKVAASKQGLLERYHSVLQQENKCLCLNGYNYYQITLASLPVTHSIFSGSLAFKLTITFSAQNNVISFSFKRKVRGAGFGFGTVITINAVLVDAGGHQLNLKCIVRGPDYICEQSINELKDMGYIVNDGFVLRT